MMTLRGGILFLLLALAAAFPAAAHASGPSTEEILKNHVLKVRPWSDVEVRNLSLSAEPPAGSPRRIVVRKGLPGPTVFTMEYGNGAVVTAKADIDVFEEIVISSRRLWKDRPLSEDDVTLARTEIGRVPSGAFRDPKEVVGKVMNRTIGANLPVLPQQLAGSKLVKRGRKVTLLAVGGGMRIATSGETRENAYVDDVVKVVNLASKKTVTGILIDETTVRVDF
ncbi:MAG: flagellar basal body P-ring formation protein FlgA [Deltaproteobacteria bacterium]|nr:flagellar basal body P-ring formation protein FlgA [Deltaproteobacteria bacterium]